MLRFLRPLRPRLPSVASLVFALVAFSTASAQDLPDLTALGGGSRAVGLGHAVTAVDLDVRSIGWNAANLVSVTGFEWAVDSRIVGSYSSPTPGTGLPGQRYKGEAGLALSPDALNFAGAALGVNVAGRPIALGVAFRRYSEGLRPFTYRIAEIRSNGRFWATTSVANDGGPRAVSPTVAVQVSDRFAVGVTANLIGSDGSYKITEPSTNKYTRSFSAREGLAPELGVLMRLDENRRIGARLVLPHEQRYTAEDNAGTREIVQKNPIAIALGTAWRVSSGARWSTDFRYAPWSAHPVVDPLLADTAVTHDAFSLHLGWEKDITSADVEADVQAETDVRLGAFVRRLAMGDDVGKAIMLIGVGAGQTWTWDGYAMDLDVGLSRSSGWKHPEVRVDYATIGSIDITVGIGLRRR